MTDKTKEKAAPTLNEDVIALAKKLEAGLALDKDTGVGTETTDLYKDNLPADLSMETVKAVSQYNTAFVAAGAYAFGQMAIKAMSGNSKLDRATAELKVGHKDTVSYNVERSKKYQHHLAKDGNAEIVKYGVISTAFEVRAGKNGGQLKAARAAIAELAADKLSK